MNTTEGKGGRGIGEGVGRDALWSWFGLDRASFAILPRAMMHDMPDEWQAKMAVLLDEWEATWVNQPDGQVSACWKVDGKFAPFPKHILSYWRPDKAALAAMKGMK